MQKEIKEAMNWLAQRPDTIFIGHGITSGDRVKGTLVDVPGNKCMEMPCAENLMMGVAIGLSLRKYRPIVIFQQTAYLIKAVSSIYNHLLKAPEKNNYPVIVRLICEENYSTAVADLLSAISRTMQTHSYQDAYQANSPKMLIEYESCSRKERTK